MHVLKRETFETPREMDFFSEKELRTQIGHDVDKWPCAAIKELTDNALDACEHGDPANDVSPLAPCIEVSADPCGISVKDNGPGLRETTLKGALNFLVRVSDKEAYVSPSRGAQGNALKTLLPMPNVLDPDQGRLIVEAHGKRHEIKCGVDPISQRVRSWDEQAEQPTQGTLVRLQWAASKDDTGQDEWPFHQWGTKINPSEVRDDVRDLLEGFALFNPHLTLTLDWFGEKFVWTATNPEWKKWRPYQPTSAHWYTQAHLERQIGAYVTLDRERGTDRLVSDFISQFDGLKRSAKQKAALTDADLHRAKLSQLVVEDRFDAERIARLLAAMQRHTAPVSPKRLGVIGQDHFKERLLALGIKPESFRYGIIFSPRKQKEGEEPNESSIVPGVAEMAFGYFPKKDAERRKFCGVNWSAALDDPFRYLGSTGESFDGLLARLYGSRHDPILLAAHVAQPIVAFTDRGKSALILGKDEE